MFLSKHMRTSITDSGFLSETTTIYMLGTGYFSNIQYAIDGLLPRGDRVPRPKVRPSIEQITRKNGK